MEAAMHYLTTRRGSCLALVGLVLAVASARPASTVGQAQGSVTAFQGARVIVGDGRAAIEDAVIVVNGARITPRATAQSSCG
jgi:hypothetical protein